MKGENWTKYESNLSNHFSYIGTDIDIDPPIIAHWFPFLGDALTASARPTISPATRMRSRVAAAADKTTTTALWAMRIDDQYFRRTCKEMRPEKYWFHVDDGDGACLLRICPPSNAHRFPNLGGSNDDNGS
jgi:hypothetical protein